MLSHVQVGSPGHVAARSAKRLNKSKCDWIVSTGREHNGNVEVAELATDLRGCWSQQLPYTLRRTSSDASSGSRWYWPSPPNGIPNFDVAALFVTSLLQSLAKGGQEPAEIPDCGCAVAELIYPALPAAAHRGQRPRRRRCTAENTRNSRRRMSASWLRRRHRRLIRNTPKADLRLRPTRQQKLTGVFGS